MFSKFTFPQTWSSWKSYMAKKIYTPMGITMNKSLELLLAAELESDLGNATYADGNEIQIYNRVRVNCPKFWSCNIFYCLIYFINSTPSNLASYSFGVSLTFSKLKKKKKLHILCYPNKDVCMGRGWCGWVPHIVWIDLCIFNMDAPNLQKHISQTYLLPGFKMCKRWHTHMNPERRKF